MQQLDLFKDYYWRVGNPAQEIKPGRNTDAEWREHLAAGYKARLVGTHRMPENLWQSITTGFDRIQEQQFQPNTIMIHTNVWIDLLRGQEQYRNQTQNEHMLYEIWQRNV